MKDRTLVATMVLAICLVAACADSGGSSASLRRETRAITRDDGVTFAATVGDASFRTEYTATSTLHEIVVGGRTIVHHGTASEGWSSEASSGLDSDGFAARLDDEDRALLERALALIDGASVPPSARERARARFGTAYVVARVLGLVTTDPDRWPYPGFEDDADAPEELGLVASTGARDGEGRQGYIPIPTPSWGCCGPKNCSSCVAGSLACEDWCAAGDACNARFGNTNNRCGTANILPGSTNKCPHSNGSCILVAGGAATFCNAFRAGRAACK